MTLKIFDLTIENLFSYLLRMNRIDGFDDVMTS